MHTLQRLSHCNQVIFLNTGSMTEADISNPVNSISMDGYQFAIMLNVKHSVAPSTTQIAIVHAATDDFPSAGIV